MKHPAIRTILTGITGLFLMSAVLEARINFMDPWYPGQDCRVGPVHSIDTQVSLVRGERLLELPVSVSYAADRPLEVGARWGVKHLDDATGINDLMLGLKYLISNSDEHAAAICGEAGVQLPTADSSNGIGAGAVGIILHWTLQKDLRRETGHDISTYFGLGYTINSENSDKLLLGNIFWYHVGAAYRYKPALRFYGELKGFNHAPNSLAGSSVDDSDFQELYLAPGVDVTLKNNMVITAAVLAGLTPESHDVGVLLSTQF